MEEYGGLRGGLGLLGCKTSHLERLVGALELTETPWLSCRFDLMSTNRAMPSTQKIGNSIHLSTAKHTKNGAKKHEINSSNSYRCASHSASHSSSFPPRTPHSYKDAR